MHQNAQSSTVFGAQGSLMQVLRSELSVADGRVFSQPPVSLSLQISTGHCVGKHANHILPFAKKEDAQRHRCTQRERRSE